jgi:cytidine deaminase
MSDPTNEPIDPLAAEAIDDATFDRLREAAEQAAGNAYAPYSRLKVGAAVRAASGRLYLGCNVENASYGLTICAERAALAAAVSAEGYAFRAEAIAVIARDAEGATVPAAPCGACRQVISEFGPAIWVHFVTADHHWHCLPSAELLPFGFVLPPR